MSHIAILTPYLIPGDAVSNDVFGMYRVLAARGHDVRMFAEGWTVEGHDFGREVEFLDFVSGTDDLLIYHHSNGWNFALDALRRASCRKVIRYHNVTPPEFFRPFSPEHVRSTTAGREQLAEIGRMECNLFLPASEYNMWELLLAGADKNLCRVVPPFHHVEELAATDADSRVLDAYLDGRTNILMVGRIAPNKGHAALIKAFATYHRYYDARSRLIIVGKVPSALESYAAHVQDLVSQHGLGEEVIFTGGVTTEALKAYYLIAHVFMITSEHEGFCVPLVEAMALKVPVVAYGAAAIPTTLGGAGLMWKERNPFLMAESVNLILSDEAVAVRLEDLGRARYETVFAHEVIEAQFLSAVGELL